MWCRFNYFTTLQSLTQFPEFLYQHLPQNCFTNIGVIKGEHKILSEWGAGGRAGQSSVNETEVFKNERKSPLANRKNR